jgi:transglutaminase-like putative cysteine protease
MRLRIEHSTHYGYSHVVQHAIQTLRLTPQKSAQQTVQQWHVQAPGTLFESIDGYGNLAHTYTIRRPIMRGTVRAYGVVETHADSGVTDGPGALSPWLYLRPTPLAEGHQRLAEFAAHHLDKGVNEATLMSLARAVNEQVSYRPGKTDVATTALEAFDWGHGVCQDQAHVFIAACRAHGVPARYVSGYFYAADAPELASHAWADVCVDPQAGRWLSIDITHQCLMDERHVRLAVGPDYAACPPIKGVRMGGGSETMEVQVDIRPV